MGWQDRDYAKEGSYFGGHRRFYRGPGAGGHSVTTRIIIANAIVYCLMWNLFGTSFGERLGERIISFGVMQAEAVWHGQIWRLFTATYLHAGFAHIFINMLMLYFLGPSLERRWGRREFFLVYTLAGIAGNVILTIVGAFNFIDPQVLGLGASGSVMALMGAAAVLFPHAEVYVYLLFPVRIRTFVILYTAWFVYNIYTQGNNYGGAICHLAGMAFGAWWAYHGGAWWYQRLGQRGRVIDVHQRGLWSMLTGWLKGGGNQPGFRDRVGQRKADTATIDRILAKVSQGGIHTLTPEEKRQLAQASDRMRRNEAGASRVDRL